MKVEKRTDAHGEEYRWFGCPGCKDIHMLPVTGARAWQYNGNDNSPTFKPSILAQGVEEFSDDEYARVMAGEKIPPRPCVCHSFVTDGRIQFLGDCTHDLKNQTVELPEIKGG
jgi:hypothetical protein